MNLTEPQAGSDVGAVRTRAEPRPTAPTRSPDRRSSSPGATTTSPRTSATSSSPASPTDQPGTRGISLFLVPKFIPDEAGRPGERNAVAPSRSSTSSASTAARPASWTTTGATGWLIGAPHQGMAAMFTMMNNARLAVGIEGLSQAEAALQAAVAFAHERRQGRTP